MRHFQDAEVLFVTADDPTRQSFSLAFSSCPLIFPDSFYR